MHAAVAATCAEDFSAPFSVDGDTPGLWHFDEVAGGDTAFDATGNGNHAVIDPNAVDPFGEGYGPLDPALMWGPAQFGPGLHTWLTSVADHNIGTLIVTQDPPGSEQVANAAAVIGHRLEDTSCIKPARSILESMDMPAFRGVSVPDPEHFLPGDAWHADLLQTCYMATGCGLLGWGDRENSGRCFPAISRRAQGAV